MNLTRFQEALNAEKQTKGIGTYKENTLHNVLKNYFEPHNENHEIKIGNFVADIVGENGVIEIQTGSFNAMRKKLTAFLEVCDVTIVYPMCKVKWLYNIDDNTGEVISKRKSPKKGTVQDAFFELYRIKNFLNNERLHFKLIVLEEAHYQTINKVSYRGKKYRIDRVPIEIIEEIDIFDKYDYKKLIPKELYTSETFTAKDFAKSSKCSHRIAQIGLNILFSIDVVERVGKDKNAFLYKVK